jgi:opacity protein-like surface antigen
MFRRIFFGVALCGGACLATAAWADGAPSGPYVSGSLGASFRPTATTDGSDRTDPNGNSVTVNGAPVPYPYQDHTQFKTGLDAEVAAGFRFNLGNSGAIRTEVAVEFGQYSVEGTSSNSVANPTYQTTFSGRGTPVQGLQDNHGAVTVNAFYDFSKVLGVVPYVGVGIGYHYGIQTAGTLNRTVMVSNAPTVTEMASVDATHTNAGIYLAEIGVSIPLSDKLSVVPAYRFSQLFNGTVPVSVVKLGMRYSF